MTNNTAPALTGAAILHRQAIQALMAGRFAEGIADLERALAANPSSVDIRNDLGTAYWQHGDAAKAEEHYTAALEIAPRDPYLLNNYGACLLGQGRFEDAEKLLNQAIAIKPDHYEIPNNVALLQHRRGQFRAAEKNFREAIRLNPAWPVAHGNLGDLYRDLKRFDLAEAAYRHALKIHPANIATWKSLGELLQDQGRYDDAAKCFKRVIEMTPGSEPAWIALLNLQEMSSRIDEGFQTLKEARQRFPKSKAFSIIEARLLRRAGKIAKAIILLEDTRKGLDLKSPNGINLMFEMGQLYDRADYADQAFQCFADAKKAQSDSPAAQALDRTQYMRTIARIRNDFTPDLANTIAAVKPAGKPAPVFLVGFPRSGTTLLDQILSSHPQVVVAEEKPAVNQMMMQLVKKYGGTPPADLHKQPGVPEWVLNNPCYPACLGQVDDADVQLMQRTFFAAHGDKAKDAEGKVFIDKLPLNIRHAALIRRVFPDAKFILAMRHPCDAVLSCFMQQFALNPAMVNFLDIKSGAELYDEIFSLWEHYRKLLPLTAHTIRYEDVVADFKPNIALLLEFLGLGWTDAVLDYDKTAKERHIATPSYHQVSEKLYTRSSGRWLKYRAHLEPVLGTLEPYIKRYGYSTESH